MKNVILCADDFALSLEGSERILQLIDRGAVSATSVMSQSPHWPQLASELLKRKGRIDIGLHFNLTEPFTREARSLSHWLLHSQLRLLNQARLLRQVLEQIDLFVSHFGCLPDFIDGHQHVHAFPVIRQALFEAVALRWQGKTLPYLRAPDLLANTTDSALKGYVLKMICRGFSAQAKQLGFQLPNGFSGLYSLNDGANYPVLMAGWLRDAREQGLIMCHPGVNEAGDAIGPARVMEFKYLDSQAFAEHCQALQVQITRFLPV